MQVLREYGANAIRTVKSEPVRNDPNTTISMYRQPPSHEIDILELEEMALSRLKGVQRLCRACDRTMDRNRRPKWTRAGRYASSV
jgi:hypothetical protein